MITRRRLFALAAAPALLTVPAFAARDSQKPKGTHVPNTSLWIEEKKIAAVYGPDSRWDLILNKGSAVFFTATGTENDRDLPHKGDLIVRIENRYIYQIEDFLKAIQYYQKYREGVTIDAVRENNKGDLFYSFDAR